ncbi:hypothetical protein QQF64_004108 [Cirrhinus molitorella]|uniref:Secreted protein n=1 Tax=Cirrhinus molitorella TaxID=172907 RepID=A0ABR3MN72_9TELE
MHVSHSFCLQKHSGPTFTSIIIIIIIIALQTTESCRHSEPCKHCSSALVIGHDNKSSRSQVQRCLVAAHLSCRRS